MVTILVITLLFIECIRRSIVVLNEDDMVHSDCEMTDGIKKRRRFCA